MNSAHGGLVRTLWKRRKVASWRSKAAVQCLQQSPNRFVRAAGRPVAVPRQCDLTVPTGT